MSNILNLRIGNSIPTKILQDDVLKQQGNDNLDWFKVANDAGGYYCRGIFVQPCANDAGFWWYWDLGCQSGIKDNGEWNQFGFIFDGNNKNITEGMTLPFSNPGSWSTDNSGTYGWNFKIKIICTINGGEDLVLDQPITIEFVDDRFDSCNITPLGDGVTMSENKRKFTITKLVNGYTEVCRVSGGDSNWDKTTLETNLKDIYVNVKGLQKNVLYDVPTDWGSVEIWDAAVGEEKVLKKERTVNNYLKEYNLLLETTIPIDDESNYGICEIGKHRNNDIYKYNNKIYIPTIIDFEQWYKDNIEINYIFFHIQASNANFWNNIKELLAYKCSCNDLNYDYDTQGFLQGSNIDGEVTLSLYNTYTAIQAFNGTNLTKINFNFIDDKYITSLNKIFNYARSLKSITTNKPLGCADVSGFVTNCSVNFEDGQINWCHRSYQNTFKNYPCSNSLTYYFLDGYLGTKIGQNGEDRFSDSNTIICNGTAQMLNTSTIIKIDPILDFKYCKQENLCFNSSSITDVRIKNLNHCDWSFDGIARNDINNNLPNLDEESIIYLFDNLYDLTTRNPDIIYTEETADEYCKNPEVDHANLYCPTEWSDKITQDMINVAHQKGWSTYINNVLQSPNV